MDTNMDANRLVLNILASFKENLASISHQETSKIWLRAFKRITTNLEENPGESKDSSAFAAENRKHCLKIAEIRMETMLRDEYSLALSQLDKRLTAVLNKMKKNIKTGGGEKQRKKLIQVVKKDGRKSLLLREDLYRLIARIKNFEQVS